ncbi:Esterase/lipase/thioesterase [Pseudocyphellaria aurata]|nr:Esterase/lipase/thioesterase [Pseudocyphellaria aurata]
MPSTKTILISAALGLASSVNAHMKMLTPIPFGNSTLNNFPLDASGSDFPCKQRQGVYDAEGAKNPPMAIGAPQTLSFLGGATHGGGSCQISLTTDKNPTKDTKWQVIHSIVGDCPSNFDGNQGESASDLGATKFQYTIPDGIKPGDYVLAWTWFNRIGNREMYMNCAPVTVTAGGSKKRSAKADMSNMSKRADPSFPDMFKANIGNGCTTAEGGNVVFPDPGSSVQKNPTFPSKDPVGGSCGTGVSAATNTGGTDSTGTSGGSGSSPVASPAEPSAPAAAPSASAPATSVPAPATSVPAATPSAPVGTAPVTPAAPATPEAPASASKGTCTSPGLSVCSPDGKQIGTCDGTNHVTFFPVAQGTVCQGGYMVMAAGKRSAKFAHGPVRRSYSHGHW